jgi:hypothetical protein
MIPFVGPPRWSIWVTSMMRPRSFLVEKVLLNDDVPILISKEVLVILLLFFLLYDM